MLLISNEEYYVTFLYTRVLIWLDRISELSCYVEELHCCHFNDGVHNYCDWEAGAAP